MVKVNGEEKDIAGRTLAEYFETTKYDMKRVATEINGEIVPKAQYAQTVLKDGDNVEVVSFVGADLENKLLMVDDDMDMSALPKTNYIKSIVTAECKMEIETLNN